MSADFEPTNIGLSEEAHEKLKRLREDGHFSQMAEAYRFAIALALAQGVIPGELPGPRENIFGVATVDPEREIYTAIRALIETGDTPVYRWAERLADWGIRELWRRSEEGDIGIGQLLADAERIGSA